jgi:transposase InsO family protein
VLDRQFTADQPNRKWIADFTYVWTAEGWLYVASTRPEYIAHDDFAPSRAADQRLQIVLGDR